MEFDSDDPCSRCHQGIGEDSSTRSDVQDEIAGPYPSVHDEELGPMPIEAMPPPQGPGIPDHGGPS